VLRLTDHLWLSPQSVSATHVSVKSFYDAQPDQDALTIRVVHEELRQLEQQSLIHLAAGLGGIEGFDALATEEGCRFAEELESRRADKRLRRAACRDAMIDWLYARGAISSLSQPARDEMLLDTRWGTWLAEPFSVDDLNATAAWLRSRGLVNGITVDECEGPVRLYLTDAGVACAEEFSSDTARYIAAQRPPSGLAQSNAVTINGPASGVIVGSHGITQHAGDAIHQASLDIAALTRFAEAVAQALPALALGPGQWQAVGTLTGEIIQAASQPEPDHPTLKALGRSLRTILEGAAGNVLAAGLLNLRHG
jgi:hypothetical protein